MAGKKSSGWAKAGKVALVLLMVFCVAIDVWYVLIYLANDLQYFETAMADVNVMEDGSVVPIIEVNYFKNADGSGREMFELNFNTVMDETRTSVYSMGYQFISKREDDGINWERVDTKNILVAGVPWFFGFTRTQRSALEPDSNTLAYKFQSADNYQHTAWQTTEITTSTLLKITMGPVDHPEVYALRFKGEDVDVDNGSCYLSYYSNKVLHNRINFVANADVNLLAYRLWTAVLGMPAVTNSMITFRFADIFQYYKCISEETGQYESVAVDSSLVKYLTDNYFGVKVTVHDEGVRRASDSMFNVVDGDFSYNTTGDYSSDEYFYGQQVIKADIYDFNLVNVSGNQYLLKLKDSFIDYYKQYADEMQLEVEIDLDLLKSKNLQFAGFTVDSGLDKFKVHRVYTKETKGEQIEENDIEWQIAGHNLAMEVAA